MPDYVVRRLAKGLNRLGRPVLGSRVLLLGLAYKKNSSDARESPSATIARLLAAEGAQVSAADDTFTTFKTQMAGHRVIFEPHATVWAEEPGDIGGLWKQEMTWDKTEKTGKVAMPV